MKYIQWILINLRVVKSEGRFKNGRYKTVGVNKNNPLTYVVLLFISIASGIEGFIGNFISIWKNSLNK